MRKTVLMLACTFYLLNVSAQVPSYYKLSYDESGNCIQKIGQHDNPAPPDDTGGMYPGLILPITPGLVEGDFGLVAYPNPTSGTFVLELNNLNQNVLHTIGGIGQTPQSNGMIVIFNMAAIPVFTTNVVQEIQLIDISGCIPGVYHIVVQYGNVFQLSPILKD